jgi:pSer/pThr/pTyr-binding forkhead associated (FHA) protein
MGRSATCDVVLPGGDVSRRHARIRYSGDAWFIQDMGSKIGLLVNGQHGQAFRLKAGDKITIGGNTLLFH